MKKLFFTFIFVISSISLHAQQTSIVVANCATGFPSSLGTTGRAYSVVDTNGRPCIVLGNVGANSGTPQIVAADTSAVVNISSATTTQLIALISGKTIYVTGIGLTVGTTVNTADTFQFVTGTGSNCANGQTATTGVMTGAVYTTVAGLNSPTVINLGSGVGQLFKTPISQALCLITTGTQNIGGFVSFTQFFYNNPNSHYMIIGRKNIYVRKEEWLLQ